MITVDHNVLYHANYDAMVAVNNKRGPVRLFRGKRCFEAQASFLQVSYVTFSLL